MGWPVVMPPERNPTKQRPGYDPRLTLSKGHADLDRRDRQPPHTVEWWSKHVARSLASSTRQHAGFGPTRICWRMQRLLLGNGGDPHEAQDLRGLGDQLVPVGLGRFI